MKQLTGTIGRVAEAPLDYRRVTEHQVDTVGKQITVDVLSESEDGQGASHYRITLPGNRLLAKATDITFQNGMLAANDVNGITDLTLLAVLIDRYKSRDGYLSDEEEAALSYLQDAQGELNTHASCS